MSHFHAELAHQHLELLRGGEIVLHSLGHQFLHLLHILATGRVKTLIVHFLGTVILLLSFSHVPGLLRLSPFRFRLSLRFVRQADCKSILLLQCLHDFIAAPPFLPVRYLPPLFIHADGYKVIMHPPDIIVPVYYIRLVAIPQPLHQFLRESDDLILRHIVRLGWIDGCVKRHLLTATAPTLILGKSLHRLLRVRNLRGEDRLGFTLGDLPLIVLHGGAATRCRRFDLDYHCRTRKSMVNSRRIQSLPAGARSMFATHTSRFTKVLSSFTLVDTLSLPLTDT